MTVPILTPERRARLRPTVDVAALERLLALLPAASRPGARSGARSGAPAREASLALAFKDPALQRLWEAVEPR